MTAVRNTLEETMTKQEEEVGYGTIEEKETNNPETKKTPNPITTRTTYGMLLVMISVFLVAGAGAGATRSYLRDATASIVVSSERDSLSCPECEPDEQCCAHGENGKGRPGYCAVYCIF